MNGIAGSQSWLRTSHKINKYTHPIVVFVNILHQPWKAKKIQIHYSNLSRDIVFSRVRLCAVYWVCVSHDIFNSTHFNNCLNIQLMKCIRIGRMSIGSYLAHYKIISCVTSNIKATNIIKFLYSYKIVKLWIQTFIIIWTSIVEVYFSNIYFSTIREFG